MSVWHQEVNSAAGIWLVGARGRLDQGLNPQLESTLLQLFADGHYTLIVDLAETTYINSGGLRILVSAWRNAHQNQGNLILCSLNARLQEIFSMVGFDKVFKIYPLRDDALQAVKKAMV